VRSRVWDDILVESNPTSKSLKHLCGKFGTATRKHK
jgi:hypothetical protein